MKNNTKTFNAVAKEQIELLFDLLIEAPMADFEEFMNINTHLQDEFWYLLGFLQGAKEALGVGTNDIDKRINNIMDLLGEWL